jgi:hypothetical protein
MSAGRWLMIAAILLAARASDISAQSPSPCRIVCAPQVLVEPTWTFGNLANRPRVIESLGAQPRRLPRERVFELVLAVDIPTRWTRVGLAGEAILSPTSDANEVELEFELKLHLIKSDQTGGWMSSHFDVVDQFSPAERPASRAYTHKLDFELDTAVAVFKHSPYTFLRDIELETSLDYLASGLPRRGDVVDGLLYLDDASAWSLSLVFVVPITPR